MMMITIGFEHARGGEEETGDHNGDEKDWV